MKVKGIIKVDPKRRDFTNNVHRGGNRLQLINIDMLKLQEYIGMKSEPDYNTDDITDVLGDVIAYSTPIISPVTGEPIRTWSDLNKPCKKLEPKKQIDESEFPQNPYDSIDDEW